MKTHGVEISIAGGVAEMVRAQLLRVFFFFLYNGFIVFRYMKLHAALAMEKTQPINQKQNIKNQINIFHRYSGK